MDIFQALYLLEWRGHATQLVGSQLPDQGSNPCPLQQKHIVLTTGLPGKFPGSLNDSCYFIQQNDPITVTVEYSKLIKQLTGYVVHSFPYLLMAPLKLATSESQEKDYEKQTMHFYVSLVSLFIKKKKKVWGHPWQSTVSKTLCSQNRGPGSIPGQGTRPIGHN